jgi:hypothetical protein
MANGYAGLVRARKPTGKRRRLDDYETPPEVTQALCQVVKFEGPILEPAAGSGRMANALKTWTGQKIATADIKRGDDFTKRTTRWAGDIVTNPPYRDGLADAFVAKALELADGRVAMLMELKFLTGQKRAEALFYPTPPSDVIIIPWRIYFIAGGKPIDSQFYNHCWIVWPPRRLRKSTTKTRTHFANPVDNPFG